MKQFNDRGFTAIEVVIAVVAVGAIGLASFFAYQNSQKFSSKTSLVVSPKPSPLASPTSSTTPSPKSVGYLTINEWGVKVPQMPSGNILSYQISGSNSDFVSSEQKALGGDCGTYNFARYHVLREVVGYSASDDVLANKLKDAVSQKLAFKINGYNYYILGDMSGGVCTTSSTAGSTISQQELTANQNLLNSLKGITSTN